MPTSTHDFETLELWGKPGVGNRQMFVDAYQFACKCIEKERKRTKSKKSGFDTSFIVVDFHEDLSMTVTCKKSGQQKHFEGVNEVEEVKDPNSWYERNKERLKKEREEAKGG